jgi:hypothetical protein
MGLFPKDVEIDDATLNSAPRRMLWTRELGTRKLLFGLAVFAAVWYGVSQAYDHSLLQTRWNALSPNRSGLTLVGTLNSRDSYDRNLFKIITANKSARVVLTEWGWNSIFNVRNGPLFDDQVANAIEAALKQDDVVGYAMLTPFLRATIRKQMGEEPAYKEVRSELPIDIPKHAQNGSEEHTTLGALIQRYQGLDGRERPEAPDVPGVGSGSGREKENVTTIAPETLTQTCPVVLTDKQCEGASLEEVQGNLLTPTTYTVHLNLTPEGRSRFFQWSHAHVNENVAFILNGQIVAAPRISQPLNVNDFAISNVQDRKAGQSLVDFMNHR